jgi:hypothetical protein
MVCDQARISVHDRLRLVNEDDNGHYFDKEVDA